MNTDSFKNAFKGFDVNNVDLATAGSWPIGVKIISYLIVFALVIFLGLKYYISDKEALLARAVNEERDLKTQYSSVANRVANLDALRKQMTDVEEQFKEITRQLPTRKELPGLLEDITNIGLESGLNIQSIAVQAEKKDQYYIELPIKISAQGTYHQVGQFVSGIAAIKRIVTLHDFSLTPLDGGKLNISLTAKTYRYDDV
ncbi:MAG: type 4a pilus biogenesis protein PilO [Pseudomonadales bacterium]